jgi:hypothetical protein
MSKLSIGSNDLADEIPESKDALERRIDNLERELRQVKQTGTLFLVIAATFLGFAGVAILTNGPKAGKNGNGEGPTDKQSLATEAREPEATRRPTALNPITEPTKNTLNPIERTVEAKGGRKEVSSLSLARQVPIKVEPPAAKPAVARDDLGRPTITLPDAYEYRDQDFSLRITDLKTGRPEFISSMNTPLIQKEKHIMISIEVKNLSDRKVLGYSPIRKTPFGVLGSYDMEDDVKNSVRDLDLRFYHGAYKGQHPIVVYQGNPLSSDLKPGESIRDVLSFKLPLPKTEYLVLKFSNVIVTFNSSPCAEKDFLFKIPLSSIKDNN